MNEQKIQELAKFLHKKYCRYNHIDGCGWFYEVVNKIDNWSKSSHKYWFNRAEDIVKEKNFSDIEIDKIIDLKNRIDVMNEEINKILNR